MLRDRKGEFNQQTAPRHKRSNDTLESFVIHMFQKGVTMFEISDLIEKMYGHHYIPQIISNMTKAMSEQVEAFKARPLDARYVCVYLDATYIAVGIREDGLKEVLAYTVAPTESAFVWEEVLLNLKKRGVEEVLLFISDGLKGITDRQEICDDFQLAAGNVGYKIFGVVMWAAAVTSVVGASYTSVYFIRTFSPALEKYNRLLVISFIVISTSVFVIIGQPILILLLVGSLNGLILQIALGVMLIAAHKAKIVGDYKHPLWMTIFGVIIVIAMAWMGIYTLSNGIPQLFR